MPKLTDTYARAYDCCDQVFTELDRFPTIDLIRERIGVNSPATIKKAMNEWTQHFAEKHFDKINRPDIPVTLLQSVEQVWKLAVIEAEKAYLQKEQGYQHTLAENQAAIDGLQQEKDFLNRTLGEARGQLAEGEQQIQTLRQQLDTQAQEITQLAGQLKDSEKQLADQHALMQEQTRRWQHQQEQDQAWFARRISEEKQYLEEKWQEKVLRQNLKITALTESETSLHQMCASLRQEQKQLQESLRNAQIGQKVHRFKTNIKTKLKR